MKDYVKELDKFISLIKNNESYAFVRFADGEGSIIENDPAWLKRRRKSSGWQHNPKQKADEEFRQKLTESLTYNDKNYFIGIPCRQAHQKRFHYLFKKLQQMTTVPEEQLTFSTVFKDYNWNKFLKEFMPLVIKKECYLVANDFAKPKGYDFKKVFTVPKVNAHLLWNNTYQTIKNYINENEIKNAVFLFAAGPGTNVIIHNLWKENKDNCFIDIGSSIDHCLFQHSQCRGKSRVYIRKGGKGYKPWKWA